MLSNEDAHRVTPYVTNTDSNIFGLNNNLPQTVKGALFSRYSRSDKGLRELLLTEFMEDSQMLDLVDQKKAEDFYDRVLVGYGDDSVAELGGAHIACEGISNIAAKLIEDSRLGLSPLEKSTRYVAFDKKVNGRYPYYFHPNFVPPQHTELYTRVLDNLFNTYSQLIAPLTNWVQINNPKDDQTSDRAYASSTRAKALDLLRGLLPMATLTNVGLYGNGRAFEYLIVKLRSQALVETSGIADQLQQELDVLIPAFVKRSKSERGREFSSYLHACRTDTHQTAYYLTQCAPQETSSKVSLIYHDIDAENKVIASILYPHTSLSYDDVYSQVQALYSSQKREIINRYVGFRASRFHRPGRAFEEVSYTFDILADIGAFRDLHRHRVLTQERQGYTTYHGYSIPNELIESGFANAYAEAMDAADYAFEKINKSFPEVAQYVVPMGYRIRWKMKLNLRELYHLVELRSQRQGHPSYRAIAQEMYRQVREVHPNLVAGMSFVDMNDYSLERLAAEQRLDQKRKALS